MKQRGRQRNYLCRLFYLGTTTERDVKHQMHQCPQVTKDRVADLFGVRGRANGGNGAGVEKGFEHDVSSVMEKGRRVKDKKG